MWSAFVISLLFAGSLAGSRSRFTNIECEPLDTSFVRFEQCDLKVLGRGVVALNIHAALLKLPVRVVKVNLALYKKFNGFRPFMYNVTFDACKFFTNRSVRLSIEKIIFDSFLEFSNINHTCPYDHDIIVQNWVFKDKHLRLLPLPTGEYKFQLKVSAHNDWKAIFKVYLYIFSEDDP